MTTDHTPAVEALTDRARIVAILNDSGSYESMEAVVDAVLAVTEPVTDRICPDCGLTARRIGDIHINAQEAAHPVTETKERRRLGPSWREAMAYEQGFENGLRAVPPVTETTDLRAALLDVYDSVPGPAFAVLSKETRRVLLRLADERSKNR